MATEALIVAESTPITASRITLSEDTNSAENELPYIRIVPTTTTTATPTRRIPSLAKAPTTPRVVLVLLPVLSLVAHFLFYYGQTAPMWRLHLSHNISVWVNATDLTSRTALDTLGLPHANHILFEEESTVRTFTYGYGLQELWKAHGMPGKLLPRFTALLLILASGIWPHLKLLLLQVSFWFPLRSHVRRQRFLHILSTFGKWSLADVITVCVMVAVMNLEWIVDPVAIQTGVIREMPTLLQFARALWSANTVCSQLLHYDCTDAKNAKHWTKCNSCKQLVHTAYTHPSWTKTTGKAILSGMRTSGGGTSRMSVIGMRGIYAFCWAVLLSIALSLVVEYLDARVRRRRVTDQTNTATARRQPFTFLYPDNTPNYGDSAEMGRSLLSDHNENGSQGSNSSVDQPASAVYSLRLFQQDVSWSWMYRLVPSVTILTVGCGIGLFTMQRQALGAIPILLQDVLGFSLNRSYSLVTLTRVTGEAGGWDLLLMGTFGIFIVVGPALRALLCVLALARITPDRARPALASAIDFIGAFCAWEVLLVAIVMVGMLMPTITNTILHKAECATVSPDNGSCFEMKYILGNTFGAVVIGGILLLITSSMAVRVGRKYEMMRDENENDEETTASTLGMTDYGVVYQRVEDDDDIDEEPSNTTEANNNARRSNDQVETASV
ncbi:hypothetical protein FisN_29Lh047 [Fistulifera solaris]|uniref:Uncharacterized protein n=1 Tax=Fistulifera solaris TaxID=1519565 RepID=A0A1Z5JLI3_FISSO|nr:hypothetical protein FisN_29Lh047 [Fistulifera solaris]|eukprot:GAX14839.1 hypothetical protein FisN_29Lh047 [Fistulifera solaris]